MSILAKSSRRSLRQRSRCISPEATTTSSPDSWMRVSTEGSAWLRSWRPRTSSGCCMGFMGSTATRTMGSAWKAMKLSGLQMRVEQSVAYLRTCSCSPPMPHTHPAGAESRSRRSRPIIRCSDVTTADVACCESSTASWRGCSTWMVSPTLSVPEKTRAKPMKECVSVFPPATAPITSPENILETKASVVPAAVSQLAKLFSCSRICAALASGGAAEGSSIVMRSGCATTGLGSSSTAIWSTHAARGSQRLITARRASSLFLLKSSFSETLSLRAATILRAWSWSGSSSTALCTAQTWSRMNCTNIGLSLPFSLFRPTALVLGLK
mmetsp:Transcript_7083/g.16556  ORF Transcript_7083/g.16556 Transcript_7083/m.16556 type:complete len:325 (+) Transcript_7083:1177-2151(+)